MRHVPHSFSAPNPTPHPFPSRPPFPTHTHALVPLQILIASTMVGVVEGLLFARRAGLDMVEAINAVSAGAAGSWSISNLGPRIAARNFDPGFFVEHFIKVEGGGRYCFCLLPQVVCGVCVDAPLCVYLVSHSGVVMWYGCSVLTLLGAIS
jgi:hypothetical protein